MTFFRRVVLCLFMITLAACGRDLTGRELGVGTGAAIGAGLGAIVGNQTGNSGAGIAIGAASGALVGGLIGNESDNLSSHAAEQDERLRRQQEELERQRREIEDLRRQDYYDSSYRAGNARVYGDPQRRLGTSSGIGDDFRAPPSDDARRDAVPPPPLPELNDTPAAPAEDRKGYERY